MSETTITREQAERAVAKYGFSGTEANRVQLFQTRGGLMADKRVRDQAWETTGLGTVTLIFGQNSESSDIWVCNAFKDERQQEYAEAWAALALDDWYTGRPNQIDINKRDGSSNDVPVYRALVIPLLDISEHDLDDRAWKEIIVETMQSAYPKSFTGEGAKDMDTEDAKDKAAGK